MSTPTVGVEAARAEVPGLQGEVHGKPLAYLDYAATAQCPQVVLDALHHAHAHLGANVHRGVHTRSAETTAAFEAARVRVARFLSTAPEQVIWTSGATDALNLAAAGLGATRVRAGDRLLVSMGAHHANLVPWQLLAGRTGARVEPLPLTSKGEPDLEALDAALARGRVAVVAVSLVSNVLGTRAPVSAIAQRAHAHGAVVVVDAAQAVPHGPLDPDALGADVVAFSGHKLYGPTGVGVLWARPALLAAWPPWKGGGDMVQRVSFAGTSFRAPPARFEAGTPPIAQAIGLHAALDWLEDLGWGVIQAREAALTRALVRCLDGVQGLRRVPGTPTVPLCSFTVEGVHPHDVGTLLDEQGVAVRTGRHCADPLHAALGLQATVRASLSFLSTQDEIARLVEGVVHAKAVLG